MNDARDARDEKHGDAHGPEVGEYACGWEDDHPVCDGATCQMGFRESREMG